MFLNLWIAQLQFSVFLVTKSRVAFFCKNIFKNYFKLSKRVTSLNKYIQCIYASRSPGLWWPPREAPVCTALCRSEAVLTPRSHCCIWPGSLWCDSGPAEGCRVFLRLSQRSDLDSMVLGENTAEQRIKYFTKIWKGYRFYHDKGRGLHQKKNIKGKQLPIILNIYMYKSYNI